MHLYYFNTIIALICSLIKLAFCDIITFIRTFNYLSINSSIKLLLREIGINKRNTFRFLSMVSKMKTLNTICALALFICVEGYLIKVPTSPAVNRIGKIFYFYLFTLPYLYIHVYLNFRYNMM